MRYTISYTTSTSFQPSHTEKINMADTITATPTAKQPNIILILADDMGYSDIGSYGGEISTPNLDQLANQGIRFSQMYNTARCCPSRASLLTGLNPHQTGVGHMGNLIEGEPSYQGYLNDRCVTIAEVLADAGYRTGISGKWHCGGDPQRAHEGLPQMQRGFEEIFWFEGGNGYFNHSKFYIDNQTIQPSGKDYLTDMISDHAVRMIDNVQQDNRPFFIHVAYTSPHWPLQALQENIENYRGKYQQGWDNTRTARHEQLKAIGMLDEKWEIAPRDETVLPWSEAPHKEWEDMRMAVYAAQIERMDQGIGKITKALRKNNIEKNTIVIFLSDNGGCAEFLSNDINIPNLANIATVTHDGRSVRPGNSPEITPGADDTYMSYDTQWANVSNTPFRRFKRWTHEGGISTPLIVNWPNIISEQGRAGQISHTPIQLMDLTALCIDAAQATYPTERNGHNIQPLEGESFKPIIEGREWQKSRPLAWEHEGNQAIRIEDWKLVREHNKPWELYNLEQDRTELNNLADAESARVAEMSKSYAEWAQNAGAQPWPPGKQGSWQFPGMNNDGSFNMRGHGHIIPRGFIRNAANPKTP